MDQSAIFGAVALGGLAIYGYARMFLSGRSTEKIKDLIPDATVVDVRTNGEYREGHFSGAMNIPVDKIGQSTKKLGKSENPVIVYCASGARARKAVRILKGMGFRDVHNGGTLASMQKLAV